MSSSDLPAPAISAAVLWAALGVGLLLARRHRGAEPLDEPPPRWARPLTAIMVFGLAALIAALVVPIGPLDEDDWYFFAVGRWLSENAGSARAWASIGVEYMSPREPVFRPVANAWFGLSFAVFGTHWPAWHAMTVALHVATAGLVLQVARALGLKAHVALAAALVFAAHPTHAEALGWINAQETQVMTLLLLGAVLLHLRGRVRSAAAVALLAMLTKEQALTVVGVIVLVDLRRGVGWSAWRRWIPVVAVAAAVLAWRALVLHEPDNTLHAAFTRQFLSVGPGELAYALFIAAPAIVATPVVEGLWPAGTVASAATALACGVIVILAAQRAGPRRTIGWAAFGFAWLVGCVLPAVADVEIPVAPDADGLLPPWNLRHFYVALVGPCLAFAWALGQLPRPSARAWAATAAVAVLAVGLVGNLQPFVGAGARTAAAEIALDARDWPENTGVRLVEPLDPIAALAVYRRLVDPSLPSVPLLVGEPRCGCARLPRDPDLSRIDTLQQLSGHVFAEHFDEADIVDVGEDCACRRWRADAVWLRWEGGRFVPD